MLYAPIAPKTRIVAAKPQIRYAPKYRRRIDMQISQFNTLPTFFEALENPKFSDLALQSAGDILVELKLEEKFGIFLLHRHFDMQDNEVLAKVREDELLLSAPVDRDTPNLTPSSWYVAADCAETPQVFEYSVGGSAFVYSEIKVLLQKLSQAGLDDIFGVFLRSSIPDSNGPLFEVSDDALRLSLVSPWQDNSHEDGWYSQSTFTFCKSDYEHGARLSNAGIACRNTTDCRGCSPSSPMLRLAVDNVSKELPSHTEFNPTDQICRSRFFASVRRLNEVAA